MEWLGMMVGDRRGTRGGRMLQVVHGEGGQLMEKEKNEDEVSAATERGRRAGTHRIGQGWACHFEIDSGGCGRSERDDG